MTDYKYIIMCGGGYWKWSVPKQMSEVGGEPLVARTIRLLREHGISDISISSNNEIFEQFGVPVLHHTNTYFLPKDAPATGPWLDAFYPMNEPVCYIFGDVVFSPDAIKTIVETDTDSIEFFASAPPFAEIYPKKWAEPFAYKVKDTKLFFEKVEQTKEYDKQGKFHRQAIAWELWQVIKGTKLDKIDFTNYTAINDYTCDIDRTSDVEIYNKILESL